MLSLASLSHELRDTPIKVNAAHPAGYELSGGKSRPRHSEGGKTSAWLATSTRGRPDRRLFSLEQRLPW